MREGYKVLVVNQNNDFLAKFTEEEKVKMYSIEIAQTADLAMEKIKSDKYHIILLDIDFPEQKGWSLLKEIKNFDSLAQFIVTTNNSTIEKVLCSLEYGANDYITDPYQNYDELIKLIGYSAEKLERWRKSIIDLVK